MIPVLIANVYYFGFGIVITMLITLVSCIGTEIIMLKLRKKKIHAIWRDKSAAVTAVLLAFTLPSLLPWYLSVIGSVFAIAIVKHTFGGLGQNIFNPAMAGFVFLLVSAPLPTTTYVHAFPNAYNDLTLTKSAQIIFNPSSADKILADIKYDVIDKAEESDYAVIDGISDGITGATFLIDAKHEQPNNNVLNYASKRMYSLKVLDLQAKVVCGLMFLLGGLFLIFAKVIDWRLPLTFLSVFLILTIIYYICAPEKYLSPLLHLVFGATIFGAFYIITDPVTAVSKPQGAYIYAAFIALIFVIIRNLGGYPDAIAFSVLLGNAFAPLIAIYTHRVPYGYKSKPRALDKE